MMKFKSLFRRGHHSHQSQQKQPPRHRQNHNQQQQQQVAPPSQASSSGSPHEDMSKRATEGAAASVTWLSTSSVGRESVPTTVSASGKNSSLRSQPQHPMKGAPLTKGSYERMQELERENGLLRKERSHLEVNLRNASTCDARRLDEHHAELALLKVK